MIRNISEKLTYEFGKGFDESNLRYMRFFYNALQICDALRHELSCTHYRLLLNIEKPEARSFYMIECAKNQWSTQQLERQINS